MIIVVPDFQGKAIKAAEEEGSFLAQLRKEMKDTSTRIIVAVNGCPDPAEDVELARVAAKKGFGMVGVYSHVRGLAGALRAGYDTAVLCGGSEETIVRLDTAEHPICKIRDLCRALEEKRADMVIGDLDFSHSSNGLIYGSADEVMHRDVFPELYGQTSGGKLRLSCAHGFQLFRGKNVLRCVLDKAMLIHAEVERARGEEVSWGFDGMIALGAIAAGLNVKVVPVPAMSPRNRPREKIAKQFADALSVCRAFDKLKLLG